MTRGQAHRLALGAGLTIAIVLALPACSPAPATDEPIRAVKVMTVGLQPLQTGQDFAAEVRARVESRLGFRVGGKLLARPVDVGQRVKAGQLLAQLDPQDLALASEAARALVAAALTSRDLAAADLKRFKSLKVQGFISEAEMERHETALKAAQAQLEQAQAQWSGQRLQSGYAQLHADASGVVTAVLAEPGQVLAAGTPVLQLAQDGARDAVFNVPEDRVAQLKNGSAASVHVWASGATLSATVREVAASADPATRTFAVKVSLPDATAPALGSTVSVTPAAMQPAATGVIRLPTSALRQDGNATAVWVLDVPSMTVRLQAVQVGSVDGNAVVVAQGLSAGMQVVVAGVHVLTAGQKVSLFQQQAAAAATTAPAASR